MRTSSDLTVLDSVDTLQPATAMVRYEGNLYKVTVYKTGTRDGHLRLSGLQK